MNANNPNFQTLFGTPPTVTADAPGRVNLIGEHTDYNGGFVLPTAIPQRTRVALTPRADRTVTVESENAPGRGAYTLGGEQRRNTWIDYIPGLTWSLGQLGIDLG